jgi:hypothetical protein
MLEAAIDITLADAPADFNLSAIAARLFDNSLIGRYTLHL